MEPEQAGETRPRGQDSRRRKRLKNKVERSQAADAVTECLMEGGTLREASEVFRRITGETISLDTLSRHFHSIMARAEHARMLDLLAHKIVDRAGGPPGWNTVALARQILQALALEATAELPDDAFEDLSAERLSLIIARLERSAALAERVRLEAHHLIFETRKDILEEIREMLQDHPELEMKVREVIEKKWEAEEPADEEEEPGTEKAPEPGPAAPGGSPAAP